ncbi:unnamed protein product [Clavelina lepadiformis]|uniref:Uncharacterized protein n=1 Tax=Clavelina lepadiformis TaxID=159417 RepID=A0ABP0G4K3_CLALP
MKEAAYHGCSKIGDRAFQSSEDGTHSGMHPSLRLTKYQLLAIVDVPDKEDFIM